jgi:TolA-binding protein
MSSDHAGPTRGRKLSALAAVVVVALLATGAVMALAGCGGKPQYCSDRSTLQQSVSGLNNVQVSQGGGVDQLKSQLAKVESDANALAKSAKSDFPSESSALQSSVKALKTAVQGLPASPSRQQLVAVAADVKATVAAFDNFKKATDSKCS